MELWNVAGLFTEVIQANDVFPAKFEIIPPDAAVAAWTTNGDMDETTHDELVGRLENVAMVATARGPDGAKASLLTWHRRLGHPTFKTVMALARDSASGMVITDIPAKVPGLDGCAACVAAKSVHLPHKEGRGRASEYLERIHVDLVGPMPVKSAGKREYEYVAVDDYSRAVYVRPYASNRRPQMPSRSSRLRRKTNLEAKMREIMTDNARELAMGEVREICERDGIKLHTTVPYHPASNGVAERTIGVLSGAVRAMLHDSGSSAVPMGRGFRHSSICPQ
jgi:hypothetical protein